MVKKIDIIFEEGDKHLSWKQLGSKYGFNEKTVRKYAKTVGFVNLASETRNKGQNIIFVEEDKKLKIEELSKKYGCSKKAIIKYTKIQGFETTYQQLNRKCKNIRFSEDDLKLTHEELGKKYNCGRDVISRKLKEFGLYTPGQKIRCNVPKFDKKEDKNLSVKELASKYNCSPAHIIRHSKLQKLNYKGQMKKSQLEVEILNEIKNWYDGEIIENYRSANLGEKSCKEIDIYLPELNIGIEVNGWYFHSEKYTDKYHHFNKSQYFKEKGIRVIHIWEWEWNNLDYRAKLINYLKSQLGVEGNKIYARKCTINLVPKIDEINFNNQHHLQGHKGAKESICIGLYYEDKLVQLASFGKSNYKFHQKYTWEWIRGCIGSTDFVIGGVSRLLNHFIKTYCNEGDTILCFADAEKFSGEGYINAGFVLEKQNKTRDIRVMKDRITKEILFKNRGPRQKKNQEREAKVYKLITQIHGIGPYKFIKTIGA